MALYPPPPPLNSLIFTFVFDTIPKEYQNPNKEVEVLQQYKAYIGSQERMNAIGKLLSFS